jgi:polysaccharide biosynthesis/export protein VpsN
MRRLLALILVVAAASLPACRSSKTTIPGGYSYPVRKPGTDTRTPSMMAPAPKTGQAATNVALRPVATSSPAVVMPPTGVSTPATAATVKPGVAATPAPTPVLVPRPAPVPATVPTLSAKPPTPALQAPAPTMALAGGDDTSVYRLKTGDPIVIYLRGIPGVPGGEQVIEDVVDETGAINLPYINAVQAGGRTATEIEHGVRQAYVDQQIYKYLTVNVVVAARSYYVRGEVRQPGRYPLVSGVTIVQAIAAAGGFTEFASPGKVEVLRGKNRFRVDIRELEKYPERDKEIEAGDVIIVQRSFF